MYRIGKKRFRAENDSAGVTTRVCTSLCTSADVVDGPDDEGIALHLLSRTATGDHQAPAIVTKRSMMSAEDHGCFICDDHGCLVIHGKKTSCSDHVRHILSLCEKGSASSQGRTAPTGKGCEILRSLSVQCREKRKVKADPTRNEHEIQRRPSDQCRKAGKATGLRTGDTI